MSIRATHRAELAHKGRGMDGGGGGRLPSGRALRTSLSGAGNATGARAAASDTMHRTVLVRSRVSRSAAVGDGLPVRASLRDGPVRGSTGLGGKLTLVGVAARAVPVDPATRRVPAPRPRTIPPS